MRTLYLAYEQRRLRSPNTQKVDSQINVASIHLHDSLIILEYFQDTIPCISKFCSTLVGWGRLFEIELLRFYRKCPCLKVYSTKLLSRHTHAHTHTTVFNESRGCFTLLRAFSETKQKGRGMGNNSHCTG